LVLDITSLDWRQMMNSWSESDIIYLRSICDEKINQIRSTARWRILISKEE
jgi:hypothetical protein